MTKTTVNIVVGATGLLGKAIVTALAEAENSIVIAADINDAGFEQDNIVSKKLDATDKDSVRNALQNIMNEYGRIDGIVNSAYPRNANYGRGFFDVTYEDFCENIGLNAGSMFLLCQEITHIFQAQGFGSIVNIGSIYGVVAPRFEVYEGLPMTMPVEYSVIKAGQAHLTRYMAQKFRKDGIRVNMVSPGGIEDGQSPDFIERYNIHGGSKGMLEPTDVVGAIRFLLSGEARYITGQNIIVDDGWSL